MVRVALGVDAGTQSLKVLVVAIDPSSSSSPPPPSADGVVLARASASLSLLPGGPPGRAEQHPAAWVDALARALADAFSQVAPGVDANVVAVGVSGQQHGLVALDSAGNVIRPAKLWCDVESAPEASEISTLLGYTLPAGFTCTKFLWLARNEPESFDKLHTPVLPHDYLNFVLSGVYAMEFGDASGVGTSRCGETWRARAVSWHVCNALWVQRDAA
ncbi:glycerolkinase [Pycnococcus provasolii]